MNGAARGSAGGKVILLGEHSVVYGRPALVAGVARRLTVTLAAGDGPRVVSTAVADDERPVQLLAAVARAFDLAPETVVATIESELPPGAGFGSSAALVIAMVRGAGAWVDRPLPDQELLRLGRELEAMFHGWSSGVDPAAAALGGCFWYALEAAGQVDPLSASSAPPFIGRVEHATPVDLVVARRAGARRTGAGVGSLRERWSTDRPHYEGLFDRIATVVRAGVAALRAGDLVRLGAIFDDNHALLCDAGVSTPEVDALVGAARAAGALGAKLTGGGAGGAIIALARDPAAVAAALRAAGAATDVIHLAPTVSHVDA
jgi:mevalonate kinase